MLIFENQKEEDMQSMRTSAIDALGRKLFFLLKRGQEGSFLNNDMMVLGSKDKHRYERILSPLVGIHNTSIL